MFIELTYFNNRPTICADDFKNYDQTVLINVEMIESILSPKMFTMPFSGQSVGKYSIVTMLSGKCFYIRYNEYMNLISMFITKYKDEQTV